MNLRTLKKLSKRAAPLLPLLGDRREQFPARSWDSYTSTLIGDRKHWERSPCHPTHEPHCGWSSPRGMPIKHLTRAGGYIVIQPPRHPRKGTVMVGCVSGYYEPEWEETTAWEALREAVFWHFTEFDDDTEDLVPTRTIETPSQVFRAADDMLRDLREGRA